MKSTAPEQWVRGTFSNVGRQQSTTRISTSPVRKKGKSQVGWPSAGRGVGETEVTEAGATRPHQPRSERAGSGGCEEPSRCCREVSGGLRRGTGARVRGGASGSHAACTRPGGPGRWGGEGPRASLGSQKFTVTGVWSEKVRLEPPRAELKAMPPASGS